MGTSSSDRIVANFLHVRFPASLGPGQARNEKRRRWVPLAVFAAIFLSHSIAAEPAKEVRRILILNELSTSYPGIRIINQGIQTALDNSPYQLEFYSEYMDTILFPDPATQQEFREFYLRKYRNRKPDVIITVGPTPLKFMQDVHQSAFPGVPIVFCLPNLGLPGAPAMDSDFTGVENDMAPAETVEVALRLLPGTKHVVVVTGVSDYDKQQQAEIRRQITAFTGRVDFTYMTGLAMPDLLERLRHLPSHTIVLLATVGQDAAGTRFKSSETGPMVAAASNAPIFSIFDVFINHGEVGGYLSGMGDQGRVAGAMALRILSGEKPEDIPTVKGVTIYMFDWRALKRWGLDESKLPPGSIVLNRRPSVWEAYKRYIIGGISLILVEALLILGLLWQRSRRRKVEAELADTHDRLRLAVEAGKAVGWDWDVETGRDRWFGDLQTMFGIPSDTYSGHVEDFRQRIHPEDRELVWKAVANARQSREQYVAEFRVVHSDGTVRWITATGKFHYTANGRPFRMLGMAVDATDRKRVEEKLQESEERLFGIFVSAMDAIIVVDDDQCIVLFNTAAENIFGFAAGEVVGTKLDRLIPQRFRYEHGGNIRRFGETGVTTRKMGTLGDLWALRATGEEFPIEASISQVKASGKNLFTVIIRDATESRRAQEAVRESEERFRLVANTAPVLIWMSDPDKLYTFFNKPWLDFTGRSIEAELGKGWADGVHPEDLSNCLDTYNGAFDRRESFKMQYRLRRNDGKYRWVFDSAVPRFNPDRSFAGYIGSCIDVTERKIAEEALASLSGRLIEAQEEERKRIAREIHDDYTQRLAVLAMDVEELGERVGDSPAGAGQQFHQIWNQIGELGADLHSLSHSLHSSTLEGLGLVAGVRAFCEEFTNQNKIQVAFGHENIPRGIRGDVALCLFRIAQEGLRNVKRHSGAERAEVHLEVSGDNLHLSITDRGKGFDVNNRSTREGIGIRSMEERLRSLGGHLEIDSRPKEGTRIDAWLPLTVARPRVA